jgi:hypothetical protein
MNGDGQSAAQGTQFANPLVVKLATNGQASITVIAGNTSGPATETAVVGALTQTFTLTVQ